MKSKEVVKILVSHGWYKDRQKGSHMQFYHATKGGPVTVPSGNGDIPKGTLASIRRQAGLTSWS